MAAGSEGGRLPGASGAGVEESTVLTAMVTLGNLLLTAQMSVTDVREALQKVARRCAPEHDLTVGVFPSAILLSPGTGTGRTELGPTVPGTLTMDQSARALRLVQALHHGEVGLEEVPARAAAIRAHTPAHPHLSAIVGNVLVGIGLATIFHCPWWSILAAGVAGALVGAVISVMPRLPSGAALMPFVAALVSTLFVGSVASAFELGSVPLFGVCAPFAVLVPGMTISNALLELTAEDIITGSARLLYGLIMLGFMQVGILAGAAVTHLAIDPNSAALIGQIPPAAGAHATWTALPPTWLGWVAVVVVAIGAGMTLGAGRRLIGLCVAIMLCAYAVLGALIPHTGMAIATGITAAALFVVSRLAERLPFAVPAPIMFQPAFLLLVPGTVGLVALAAQNTTSAGEALLIFASLCLGVKCGAVLAEGAELLRTQRRAQRGR